MLKSESQAQNKASLEFAKLCNDFWETAMELSPTWATYLGDHRYDDRLPKLGPLGRSHTRAQYEMILKRLDAIDIKGLSPKEELSAQVLKLSLTLELRGLEQKLHEWNIDQMEGPQVWFLELLNYHPMGSKKDIENLVKRFDAFPVYMRSYLSDLSAGLADGHISPKLTVERVIEQLKKLLATKVEESPLMDAARKLPKDLPETEKDTLKAELKRAVTEHVYPMYQEFLDFLAGQYLPRSRTEVGISAIPGGLSTYQHLIRKHTSTELTPDEIHQIGLTQLEKIQKEMAVVARRMGHQGDLKSFIQSMKDNKKNFGSSREELLKLYGQALERATKLLPTKFSLLPKTPCIIKAIEEYREKDTVAAFYYAAPVDGSRPAVYYANTYDPTSRPLFNVMPLTVHEAVPGHHLQIALAQENLSLPTFRRHSSYTVFVEGWALYAERLADEMGLYDSDLSRVGMLTYQAWRACRLVVDTGMHTMGWTRDQAITFMKDNLALSEGEIVNEVDRYIIWPGQALAYMIGQREFFRLREKAQKALGPKFDLRKFHEVVLREGPIPMFLLEKQVDRWVSPGV